MKNYNNISKPQKNGLNTQTSIVDEVPVESTKEKQTKAIVVNCTQLNLRKEPTKDSDVICILKKGVKLIIGEYVDGWVEVYDKPGLELEGYVMAEFIKEV